MITHTAEESLEKIASELKYLEHLKSLPILLNEISVLTDVLTRLIEIETKIVEIQTKRNELLEDEVVKQIRDEMMEESGRR